MNLIPSLEKLINDPAMPLSDQIERLREIFDARLTGQALADYVKCVRKNGHRLNDLPESATDIVGTGADGSNSFNVSTTAAFVMAGAGIIVAKHGNRSTSSLSGSFDCLQALKVNIPTHSHAVIEQINQHSISFLFAPFFYPSLAPIAPARKALAALGEKNIFQLLGPLLHPGKIKYQVLGVYDAKLMPVMAEAMQILGITQGAVVHSEGLDELSLVGNNQILLVDKNLHSMDINPIDFGLKACKADDLSGGDAGHNAVILESILRNELPGPKTDTVLLNAALGLYLHNGNFIESFDRARQSIESGAALKKLQALRN
ncbi:MAG: anthranilate phosphoribosyltransferase [Gammaproteobacteria bacterium]|nr:anthranilate phosphoribosyltransferase [Gammaproteobacteria bacterium]